MKTPVIALVVLQLPIAASAASFSQSFAFTGAEETFVVPRGVYVLDVDAVGGQGGAGFVGPGGAAARVRARLAVSPGDLLYVRVGGAGQPAAASGALGGFNGGGDSAGPAAGGAGGGASDVRTLPGSDGATLTSRLVVAAGGGGTGFGAIAPNAAGGAGGLPIGSPGTNNGTSTTASGGGGTANAGGAAAIGCTGGAGEAGSFGRGGGGDTYGGGGGGGYFGGGGGCNFNPNAGSGGGGSSFVHAGASDVAYVSGAGVAAHITLTWKLPDVTISDVVLIEGSRVATFTVGLSAPAPGDGVLFDVHTVDGTATAGQDYEATALTDVTLAAGMQQTTIDVPVLDDDESEGQETFQLVIDNVRGAATLDGVGQATVVNDDVLPLVSLFAPHEVVIDQDTQVTIGFEVVSSDEVTVSALTSNTDVVATDGLALGGDGALRTLHITPVAHAHGETTIGLSAGNATASMLLTVLPREATEPDEQPGDDSGCSATHPSAAPVAFVMFVCLLRRIRRRN